jgi:O-succinylbenzoate synthase
MARVIRTWRIPMTVPFRGVTAREGVLIAGPEGWGEFSPFPEYGPEVAASWLRAAIESADHGWPEPRRDLIPVNTTVPAVDPEKASALVTASKCTTAKVKVAQGDDYGRVEAVRSALGPAGRIRLDANGAWDVESAEHEIKRLSRFDLEYVEQPVATIEEMAALRRRIDVPIAADESIRNSDDPQRVAHMDAADVIVLKVQPLGGVRSALNVAERVGLPVVVSSALETSIGIAAGLALAAALPELPFACGLGTVTLLEGDLTNDPLVPVDGAILVRRPDVDEHAIARYEAGAAATKLLERMHAASAHAGISLR